MLYEDILQCINTCDEHINEGGGKITNVVLKGYKLPENIKILIKEDYKTFMKIINYYYQDIKLKIPHYDNYIDTLNNIEFISIKSNDNKKKITEYNEIILPWLKSGDFFSNIYETHTKDPIDIDEITSINEIPKFIPRENQKEAFDRLNNNGLETGIHCQATGCGKSFIIIKYIDYTNNIIKNPKIILFTERVSILSDFFSFNKGNINADINKLNYWKNLGIGDLTNFDIINRVTIKKKDWVKLLKESIKPTLLIINRAYLTLGKLYDKLDNNDLHLILHDECHNTSSDQCHELLLKCKSLNIPIVGFSATPLRTGKDDKPRLLEIYSKSDNKDELNLLTDYNMIYAISQKLILPPEFFWYQLESYDKDNETEIVSQEDLGSLLELLNYIIPFLPNKKLIAWCGTITLAQTWKKLIEQNYRQRSNMKNFLFGIDTSLNDTEDYLYFSKKPKVDIDELPKHDKRRMYYGNSILFCANKHREGSDIKLLDGCIFLDKVKNRGSIPFIQSIGRVLRTCPDTPDKFKGVVIDGIVKDNNNYDRIFVDKIIGYYMALENLTSITGKTRYDQYIEMKDIVKFDKEKEIIKLKLKSSTIKIHCNKLEWSNIISKFDKILSEKIKLSAEDSLLIEYNYLKSNIKKYNFVNKDQYYNYAIEKKITINPFEKYNKFWINWYDFLDTDISIYPKTKYEWKLKCDKLNLNNKIIYLEKCDHYNLPYMPEELYNDFTNFYIEFDNLNRR